MRLVSVVAGLVLIAVAVGFFAWQNTESGGEDGASAEQEITQISYHIFRGSLEEDEHPAIFVDSHPTVALVTLERMKDPGWSSESGEFEGVKLESGAMPPLIYTPVVLDVEEYIKGSGPEVLAAAVRGGVADGVRMDMHVPLQEGDRAVVFLNEPHERYGGPMIANAYVFDGGDMATSELDQKTLSVTELLDGLREAVAEQAGG